MKRLLALISLIALAGCATVAYPPAEPGIYHEVKRGQTLWHISRIYGVELNRLIKANRMPDASKIEVGQLIFVPEARGTYAKSATLEGFIWPVKGVVVSYFGSMKDMAKNKGVDIRAREGTKVVAAGSGKVTFVSNHLKGYGKTIIIDHSDGFETVYSHNAQNLARVNQHVKQGEAIAKVGKTGRVKKPTLHFEIRKRHKPQNPFYYLP